MLNLFHLIYYLLVVGYYSVQGVYLFIRAVRAELKEGETSKTVFTITNPGLLWATTVGTVKVTIPEELSFTHQTTIAGKVISGTVRQGANELIYFSAGDHSTVPLRLEGEPVINVNIYGLEGRSIRSRTEDRFSRKVLLFVRAEGIPCRVYFEYENLDAMAAKVADRVIESTLLEHMR